MITISVLIKVTRLFSNAGLILGFLLSDLFISSLIEHIRLLMGENITNEQIHVLSQLFTYRIIFDIFVSISFWTFFTCLELKLKDKIERKNNITR